MKNDVEKYIDQRKRADKAFAKDFEAGYEQFKIDWWGMATREGAPQAAAARGMKYR